MASIEGAIDMPTRAPDRVTNDESRLERDSVEGETAAKR
jgi:hypothetical protein